MNILLLGATGNVGSRILTQASTPGTASPPTSAAPKPSPPGTVWRSSAASSTTSRP